MMKSITELTGKELRGKKVLLRVDFNVPVEHGKIRDVYRINANKEILDFLANCGAIIGMVSHITAINSFEIILDQIKKILNYNPVFLNDCIGPDISNSLRNAKSGDIFLLENVRKYDGEEKNSYEFAKKLVEPFEIYVNNAFSVSHRNHASVVAVTKLLPSYAGPLMVKETMNLGKILKLPKENKTLIIGGAKIETKLPVIENFLDKSENILIGGAIANVFLKAKGVDIKKSLSDDQFLMETKEFLNNPMVIIPDDYIFSDEMILDIGPKTVDEFRQIIKKSEAIVWNGPLGKAEVPELSRGTQEIAKAISNSAAFSVVGGGDTVAFLEKNNLMDKFGYVSTGGGAMLEFLAGNKLPGLEALDYYGA